MLLKSLNNHFSICNGLKNLRKSISKRKRGKNWVRLKYVLVIYHSERLAIGRLIEVTTFSLILQRTEHARKYTIKFIAGCKTHSYCKDCDNSVADAIGVATGNEALHHSDIVYVSGVPDCSKNLLILILFL